MNKRTHRWIAIESVTTDPRPRTRVTCLVDRDAGLVQVRLGRGPSHQTVTMSIGAWRRLVQGVDERIEGTA